MPAPKTPAKTKPHRINRVAIDGTLDHFSRIKISVREKGHNAEPFELRIAHKESMREYVECHNPACFNGGFSLGDILREMAAGRQEEFIGTSFCTGQEGDPDATTALASAQDSMAEEPGPHPSCATRFEIEASIRFR